MDKERDGPFAIIVHGGAWKIPQEATEANLIGVRRAAAAGYEILAKGGTALDAVEVAVRILEDDPTFAAGNGSCLTRNGTVELDAAVMYSPPSTEDIPVLAGGVCSTTGGVVPKNAVTLARAVAEESEHVLLCAHGAIEFARKMKIELIDAKELVSPTAHKEWKYYNQYSGVVSDLFESSKPSQHDTVGAAVLDRFGGLAAGTSTGGITYKSPGRVGDSSIPGAGLYTERGVGAVSTTGHGESILMSCLARSALWQLRIGGDNNMQKASEIALEEMKTITKGKGGGGIVMVNRDGEVCNAFSTSRMAWAAIDKDGAKTWGIEK